MLEACKSRRETLLTGRIWYARSSSDSMKEATRKCFCPGVVCTGEVGVVDMVEYSTGRIDGALLLFLRPESCLQAS